MATKMRWERLLIPIVGFALLAGGVVAQVQAGKPTPPPFQVRYGIRFLVHPDGLSVNTSLSRINTAGIAFGGGGRGCKLYLCDANTGYVCWDIATLLPVGTVPPETTFSAAAISDLGLITGTMYPPDGSRWAYVIDTHNNLSPEASSITVLDNVQLPRTCGSRGYGINDAGELLGLCYDAGTGAPYLFMCDLPYRCFPVENIPRPMATIENFRVHEVRINSSGDLKVKQGMDPAIYHESSKYLFLVEDLVNVSETDRWLWESRDLEWGFSVNEMTDRVPGNGSSAPRLNQQVGRLCGSIGFDTAQGKNRATAWIGVVLTPEYSPF